MKTRRVGELVEWDDDRGFGFIRAEDGERLFIHIKSIAAVANRPRVGDRLNFDVGTGRDGRPAAVNAKVVGANPLESEPTTRGGGGPVRKFDLRFVAALLLLAAVLTVISLGRAPPWLLAVYLSVGVLSIALYWADKSAAEGRRWRVQESTLHGVDLLGGIVGGLLAQALLRHKTSKVAFGTVTAGIVVLHLLGLTALILGLFDLA